ncbi:lipocalin-like domain-containing protein [uncultured Aquimonas sp.]|uniref:lipocalin-like domain-containing protein n=1 Tax=uncultured Aquimonas sp. TaxID=385483 RepID=UPI000B319DA6|nr:lipocalin-like domain-containing protein [uncultured Aquimonas sp.]
MPPPAWVRIAGFALALLLAGCGLDQAPLDAANARSDVQRSGRPPVAAASSEQATTTPAPLARTLQLGEDTAGFDTVAPRALGFPADHGAHPRHRIEWWYLTARLQNAQGRRFGAQWALFRFALRPEDAATRADFAGGQVYMLHAAVSDLDRGGFRHVERFARGAVGLAGVQTSPWRGWLGDCVGASSDAQQLLPLTLDCGGEDFRYRLELSESGPRVLHGEGGYSAKSDLPGAASYYYAYPFLDARGEIEMDGETHAVQGGAWYDHEWTSSLLGDAQVGWDWFSLRFDSGEALMLFHIRDRSGEVVSSRGSFIHADGRVEPFADGMVEANAQRQWLSPKTGVRYPLGWRLRSTRFDFDLEVDSVQDAQELDTTVRYWEGAIDARGRLGGREAQAEGYLELTGYGE